MSQVNYTVIIETDQDRVWDLLMDVPKYSKWLQGVREAQLINVSEQQLGAQLVFDVKGGKFRFDVVSHRPKDLVAWKLRPSIRGGFSLFQAFGTVTVGDRTKVTVLELYGGVFGFTMRWIMGLWFRRKLAQTLLAFRELAEQKESKKS